MKCEKCNAEILPGQLLCPKCGWEVQMVPAFESVVDDEVKNVMEDITDHIIRTQEEEERDLWDEHSEKQNYRMHLYSTVITFGVVAVVAIILLITRPWEGLANTVQENDQPPSDPEAAVSYYEELALSAPDDKETLLLLGQSYDRVGRFGDAIRVLSGFSTEDREEINVRAARTLADIYINTGDYRSANDLLLTAVCDDFREDYQDYVAYTPEFSVAQDTYDQPVFVKILYKGTGGVYYTLDGQDPDSTSALYENPILLEKGIYTLKAVAVTPYGIMSDIATSIYEIKDSETQKAQAQSSNPNQFLTDFDPEVDPQEAVNYLIAGLMKNGRIAGILGEALDGSGNFIFVPKGVLEINHNTYHLIEEQFRDIYGDISVTGALYCVDTNTRELYNATVDEDGHYSVVSF